MELVYSIVLIISGFAIGLVGGLVGLVLGVVRYPIIMIVEPTVSITAGTNLGVSTLGAATAASCISFNAEAALNYKKDSVASTVY
jgi:uncharacterized membrane protein YfcA